MPKYLGKPGAQIRNLSELSQAVDGKRAVIGVHFHRPQPAAWVFNLSGGHLLNVFSRGLFIYEKPEKREKNAKRSETKGKEKDGQKEVR